MFELQELCKAFREADAEGLRAQAEYLAVKRLAHPSAEVKAKCLRAIKHCCSQPGMQPLRTALQPHLASVRGCTTHTGPAHALRGDAPHRIVRELAAEALRAATLTENQAQALNPAASGMQGFGTGQPTASSAGGFGGVGAPTSGGQAGLGGQVMEGFGSAPQASAAAARPRGASWGRSFGAAHGPRHTVAPPASPGLSSMSASSGGGSPAAWAHGSAPARSPSAAAAAAVPAAAALGSRGALEIDGVRVVREFVTPRGLRRQVTGEDVRLFVQGVSQGDGVSAAAALRDALASNNPQSQNRALVGLHALLERGNTPACARLAEDFDRDPAALEALAQGAPQEALRARAATVLGVLRASGGVAGAAGARVAAAEGAGTGGFVTAAATSAGGAPVPLSDLLGPGGGDGGGAGRGLFSGMDVAERPVPVSGSVPAAPGPPQVEVDLLGGLEQIPAAPAAGMAEPAAAVAALTAGGPQAATPALPAGSYPGQPGVAGAVYGGALGAMPQVIGAAPQPGVGAGGMLSGGAVLPMMAAPAGAYPGVEAMSPIGMGGATAAGGLMAPALFAQAQPQAHAGAPRGPPASGSPRPQKPPSAFDFVGDHMKGLRQ